MEVEFAAESIFILIAVHLTLGTIFFVVILARKLQKSPSPNQGWRAGMLWISLATLGLALGLDSLFLVGRPYAPVFRPPLTDASLLSVGVALGFAVLGKGSGRVLLASAAGLLAIWEIPLLF